MPELPDISLYVEALESRVVGHVLGGVRVASPFLVRTFDPPLTEAHGKKVLGLGRLGKRVVFGLEGELFLVLHLMIAGRLRLRERGEKLPAKVGLAAFDFDNCTLLFTEASPKKRASLHVVRGRDALAALDPGGIDPLGSSVEAFAAALRRENHTLKRSLTDPRVFSGIGNAYSDEILHRARMSPIKQTKKMTDDEIAALQRATIQTLEEWITRLREQAAGEFPEKVTAFHEEMAVHGKHKQPCPRCGAPVQRIVYAANEANYCAPCQTEGKLLADRALSRLLGKDFPKTLEDLEAYKAERKT